MMKCTEQRQRWEEINHLYVLTTPDSLIFSYKQLSGKNPLEKNILEMVNPVETEGETLMFELVSKKYQRYLKKNGSLEYEALPKEFFLEKLVTVVGDRDLNEFILDQICKNFDGGKGYEVTLGRQEYNRR